MAPEALIPAPLPFHASLAGKYVDWMRQRVGSGRIRGLFLFILAEGGGTIEFRPVLTVDVLAIMALNLPEEIATSIWFEVGSNDSEKWLLAMVVDRTEGTWSFVRIAI
jgi:hypothetical protein